MVVRNLERCFALCIIHVVVLSPFSPVLILMRERNRDRDRQRETQIETQTCICILVKYLSVIQLSVLIFNPVLCVFIFNSSGFFVSVTRVSFRQT